MRDKHQTIEEPCDAKVSRTVLKTSGAGDSLAEFNTFATISDGNEIEAPLPYKKATCGRTESSVRANRRAKIKLGKIQYRNRNKKLGNRKTGEKASNNAKKYYKKLARFHKRIADKRKDFLNKTTTSICKKYAHIRIEDLNVAGSAIRSIERDLKWSFSMRSRFR